MSRVRGGMSVEQKKLVTVIQASKWARGGRHGNQAPTPIGSSIGTHLANMDGTMCCLGFDAVQRGARLRVVQQCGFPSNLGEGSNATKEEVDLAKQWSAKYPFQPSLEKCAVDVNDNKSTTDEEKIAALRPIFAAVNPPREIDWRPNE